MILNRIVNSFFASNTYILQEDGTNDAYLVDVGDIEPIFDRGLNIKGVFITHGHFDHIYGIESLIAHYPDCKIYTNTIGREYLADMKLNLSKYHGTPVSFESTNFVEVVEDSEITIFDRYQVKVFETPGHNPSCLVFRLGKYLFTGDAYIPKVKLVTNVPKADKQFGFANRKRIKEKLIDEHTIVCAGHGEFYNPKEKAFVTHE